MSTLGSLWDRRPEWPLVTRGKLQRDCSVAFDLGAKRRRVVTNEEILTGLADLHEGHLTLMTNVRTLKASLVRIERNAFEIGVDAGAAGLVKPSAAMAVELRDDHTGGHP